MKLAKLFWIPLLALLAAGCMEIEQDITINQDASGVVKTRFALSKTMLDMMEAAKKQGGDVEMKGDFPATEEDVRKKFADAKDVTVTDIKVEDKDGKRHVSFTAESKNLAKLFELTELGHLSLAKDAEGNYTLWSVKGPKEKQAKTPEEEAMEKQMKEMMKPMLRGLKATLRFTVPGDIIETTAHTKTGNTAQWSFDVDKDASFLDDEPEFKVKFNGSGVTLPEIKGRADDKEN